MNTPKKKYDFDSRMLFAFTNGIKVGQRLQEGDCEKEIADAKKQFCRLTIFFCPQNHLP